MKNRILFVCSLISLMQAGNASVVFQLSAPGVQQSSFQADGSYLTESFDGLASLASSGTLAVGDYSATGTMVILSAGMWGGAGGTGKYAFTGSNGQLSVELDTPSKYFGLWFTASNPGNYVDVYSGANLLATFDTQSLSSIVGLKASPNSVLASDGNHYSGDLWYGNPNEVFNDSNTEQYVYAYVNMGLSDPNATFDRIVMRGVNFEFDNLTTSSSSFVSVVPEPAGCATLAGVLMLGFSMSRRRSIGSDRILQGGN
jgi:hypothetical protein